MIDFIGDIHGHADKLEELLLKLGYSKKSGVYAHPERKVLFVGDYIDRGPKIRETLQIVKAMVENENAIALMGNHEYNAICFHFQKQEGGHLRKHSITNIIQHYETLQQFKHKQEEYEEYINWFMTLPLYYETKHFKAVHACWDNNTIDYLRQTLVNDKLTYELIYQSVEEGTALYNAIEQTLKGKELKMPEGQNFLDNDGIIRTDIRIKWWENPAEMTFKSICIEPYEGLPETKLDVSALNFSDYYKSADKIVFFGHYWLKGNPSFFKDNVCCLDYSVAKNGKLVAYRFQGEDKLDTNNLMFLGHDKKENK